MHPFSYRNGALHAEDVALAAIAEAVGTPFYCYSSAAIEGNFEAFRSAFAGQNASLFYAMKANSNQAVLATLAKLGAGMDVVSEGELRRARAAGVPGERIIFSGVGKTLAEMSLGLEENILCFNVESEPELEALSRVGVEPRRNRADRNPRQSRRRRPHPRQDCDRQVGEQVRRADLARPRRLRLRPRSAGLGRPRRRHAYRLADHRSSAVRRRVRAARRLRADVEGGRARNRACRSRRRPRHSLPERQQSAPFAGALRRDRRPPYGRARLQGDFSSLAAHRRRRRSAGRLGHLPQEG